ncbi:MAG: LppX_LprAFG lipoprotein [Chloroflexi bacterium]|nr:LppX_LprAFG lipoprotein [Chloroflexota bacterium]
MHYVPRMLCALIVATIALAVACGRNSDEGSLAIAVPSPTPVNPQVILERSGEAMEALESFHFRLIHESGGTPLGQGLVIREVQGDVARPDKISLEVSGLAGSFAMRLSLITIGDNGFISNPITGEWEPVPADVSPLGFFEPTRGVSEIMRRIESPRLISADDDSYAISGTIASEGLASLFGAVEEGNSIDIDVVIDATSLFLLEARLEGRITTLEEDGVIRVITLSRFNEPVEIELPVR